MEGRTLAAEHDFLFFPLAKQAELLHTKQLSPVELVEASIRRIEQTDKTLCAWIAVGADQAMASARQTEREILKGQIRGPLHGIPFGVKDQMHALGFKTSMGTRVLDEHEMQAPFTATAIERLKARKRGGAGFAQDAVGRPRIALIGRAKPLSEVNLVAITSLDVRLDAFDRLVVSSYVDVRPKGRLQLER